MLIRRFDRTVDQQRTPFLSAMAMVGARDRDEEHSYLEIADAIRSQGDQGRVEPDLRECWRRMVFNVLISNTDDHLRNHGFLRSASGWTLSEAYDLNPVPVDVKPRVHALALDDTDTEASLETVFATSTYFGLADRDSATIAGEVGSVVSQWRQVAASYGLSKSETDRMASAFEHDDLNAARRFG